jgi:NAD-dependent dihydropyrimidine dehydrogenase PreA subunit
MAETKTAWKGSNQMTITPRKIVKIDEDLCDGCGLCVPQCAEGAIKIIDGKARLIADNLCDGLGNCLGQCPKGAITIEERAAEDFDPQAVSEHLEKQEPAASQPAGNSPEAGGCPGAALRKLQPAQPKPTPAQDAQTDRPSQLGTWPVQLGLLPTGGDMWQNADVLIAADCVSTAMPDFHEKLLAGKTLAIGCPKLDDILGYAAKLEEIFTHNDIRSVTVAHMEVPCCNGIVMAVSQAISRSGKSDIKVKDITIGIDGTLKGERNLS